MGAPSPCSELQADQLTPQITAEINSLQRIPDPANPPYLVLAKAGQEERGIERLL